MALRHILPLKERKGKKRVQGTRSAPAHRGGFKQEWKDTGVLAKVKGKGTDARAEK